MLSLNYFCLLVVVWTNQFALEINGRSCNNDVSNDLIQKKLKTSEESRLRQKDCSYFARKGCRQNGLYKVTINGKKVEVYCDLQTDGGNWTVIQRRQDGSVDFYRNWTDYVEGFGNKTGEFWLDVLFKPNEAANCSKNSLDNLYQITSAGTYELRVDLQDFDGQTAFAKYSSFVVKNAAVNYELHVNGYSGTAGNSLAFNNNRPFTTKDRDNDRDKRQCGIALHGGWWFNTCSYANLNGKYFRWS